MSGEGNRTDYCVTSLTSGVFISVAMATRHMAIKNAEVRVYSAKPLLIFNSHCCKLFDLMYNLITFLKLAIAMFHWPRRAVNT